MKLDCLLFLESSHPVVRILQSTGTISAHLKKKGDCHVLFCKFVSDDACYLRVKAECPNQIEPEGVALLMIPHASVRLVMQADRPKVLGFAA